MYCIWCNVSLRGSRNVTLLPRCPGAYDEGSPARRERLSGDGGEDEDEDDEEGAPRVWR